MKLWKKIVSWIFIGIISIIALAAIPSFSCIIAAIITAITLPIDPWQNILRKHLKMKTVVKIIVIAVLTILMLVFLPTSDTPTNTEPTLPVITEQTQASTAEATPESTIESTQAPTTEPTQVPITEPTQAPTTEPTTEPTQTPATTPAGNSTQNTGSSSSSGSSSDGSSSGGSSYGGNSSASDGMVWIPTNGGKKYHTHSGCSNMENPQYVTKEEAEELGFTPCKRCH